MNFSKVQFGKNTGMKGDRCNEQDCKEFTGISAKPLKYYTTNYFKEGVDEDAGINFNEGYGICQSFIDQESKLSRSTITNPKIRQNLGELPLASIGGLANSGPIISATGQREKKTCVVGDNNFQDRRFWFFNNDPNAVQTGIGYRQGEDTRQDTRTSYTGWNMKDC